jgi:hypothetical protein
MFFFVPCDLTLLFFAPYDSFRIVDSILFIAKDEDDTSDQTSSQNRRKFTSILLRS